MYYYYFLPYESSINLQKSVETLENNSIHFIDTLYIVIGVRFISARMLMGYLFYDFPIILHVIILL